IVIRPDCADFPYFLRAYFAFKMGLPFGYTKCTRGGGGHPPRCPVWWNIEHEEPRPAVAPEQLVFPPEQLAAAGPLFPTAPKPPPGPPPRPAGLAASFGHYLRWSIADAVHSGNGRTSANDDNTDYYPVPLNQDALRPGTVYADPYGHILVLVKRVPQTGDAAGVLLAVDAQPDGT